MPPKKKRAKGKEPRKPPSESPRIEALTDPLRHPFSILPTGEVAGYPFFPAKFAGDTLLHIKEFYGKKDYAMQLVKVMQQISNPIPVPSLEDQQKPLRAVRREDAENEDKSQNAYEDPEEITKNTPQIVKLGLLRACVVFQCIRAAGSGQEYCLVRMPRWTYMFTRRPTEEEFKKGKELIVEGEDLTAKLVPELFKQRFNWFAVGLLSDLAEKEKESLTAADLADAEVEREQMKTHSEEQMKLPEEERTPPYLPQCLFISWDPNRKAVPKATTEPVAATPRRTNGERMRHLT